MVDRVLVELAGSDDDIVVVIDDLHERPLPRPSPSSPAR
jgi:hypothetical protein